MKKILVVLAVLTAACGNSTGNNNVPLLTATPDTLAFGNLAIGDTSKPETLAVNNVGTFPASDMQIFVGGAASDYNLVFSDCGNGAVLVPGTSCIFVLTFVPLAPAGEKDAFIELVAEPSGGAVMTFTGNALATP